MKTHKRFSIFSMVLLLVFVSFPYDAKAASANDWSAGNIIDDALFTDAKAMSTGEIQAFLNAQVPTCDTNGQKNSDMGGVDYNNDGRVTRREYAQYRGYGTNYIFTCLKEYYEVPKTTPGSQEPASNYGGAAIPAGAQSAAQLISNAAIKYNISPKVLLVKLATESPGPLTSDDWPFKRQYLYAMGAHCPDSGPGGAANCDSNYAGFSLQMDEAASLMRWYLDSMTQSWWQYKKPFQTNNILWNVVERGCGGSNVYIESKATAALYTYTPYQPNKAALDNLYGTGDNCSAYGNRNFWRVYYDWFGSTTGDWIKNNDGDELTNGTDLCKEIHGSSVHQGCQINGTQESNSVAGDFNGDGFGDVLAFSVFPDGKTFNVWLFPGSVSGLGSPVFQRTLGPSHGGWSYQNSKPVATDVNNDNFDDLVIFHRGPNNEIVRHVMKGSTAGIQTSDPAMVVWQSPSDGWSWTNVRLVGGGDFNGDGFGDVLAFSVNRDGYAFNSWTFLGSASGLQMPSNKIELRSDPGGWSFKGSKPAITDVNNDNFDDLVIFHRGPNNEIVRHVMKGSTAGIQTSDPAMVTWQYASQGWLWDNVKIVGGGDFNGDGFGDVLAFSAFHDNKTFNVWSFPGATNGLANPVFYRTLGPAHGGWLYGSSKPVISDVNNDNYDDLVMFHRGPNNEIVRHVLRGSAQGIQNSDPNNIAWQYPSQGWLWDHVRLVGGN